LANSINPLTDAYYINILTNIQIAV